MPSMPSLEIGQSASAKEAAAIAAAIQQFSLETSIAPQAAPESMNPWLKNALEEGVSAKEAFGPGAPFGTL